MKAVFHNRFGTLDVLETRDLDLPTPAANEVRIKVRAAGVNPGDRHAIRGVPYAARLMGYGLTRPKQPVPGQDFAGVVDTVGERVTRFEPGDEVFGWSAGTFAEYATAPESSVAAKPGHLTFEQAAAVPTAGFAALQAGRDVGRLQTGDSTLIIGASGGVGTFAVQIAKAMGAQVTGVAGTRNLEMVRSAGADHVIDYTTDDPYADEGCYDQVIDLVGAVSLRRISRILDRDGTGVIVGGPDPDSITGMGRFASALLLSPLLRRRLRPLFSTPSHDDLETLRQLIDDGKVLPVIDATYDLAGAADALRDVEAGHSRGKVVITV